MRDDDPVCLCFHVSKRKIVNYCRRERPPVPSLISECLSAGTGCGWCIPFLKKLHEQVRQGEPDPDLPISPQTYARRRAEYRRTGERDPKAIDEPSPAPSPAPGSLSTSQSASSSAPDSASSPTPGQTSPAATNSSSNSTGRTGEPDTGPESAASFEDDPKREKKRDHSSHGFTP